MVLFALLHWSLSQSIFLVQVDFYDSTDSILKYNKITTCGYSNIAIITSICIASIIVIFGLANAFRRFKVLIPLAGGCSAVISAACHQPKQDDNAPLERVKWGVVDTEGRDGKGSGEGNSEEETGHCCITSLAVSPPVEGTLYA